MKISVENVHFAYNGMPTLSSIDLELSKGEVLAVVGPNGSGKSTLLKLISGVLRPKLGRLVIDGVDLARLKPRELAQKLGALEQEHHVGFDFSVRELVGWGRMPHISRLAGWTEEDERAVQNALAITGLDSLAERSVVEISGGERQRVHLAMAMAQEPEILLLDEPTAHLDMRYQIEILEIIKKLSGRGISVVVSIHDLNLATRAADRLAVLSHGALVASGSPREVLTPQLIEEVWGVRARVESMIGGVWIFPEL